jgi:hypothetical protein
MVLSLNVVQNFPFFKLIYTTRTHMLNIKIMN